MNLQQDRKNAEEMFKKVQQNVLQRVKLRRTFLAPRKVFMPALQMGELRQEIELISAFSRSLSCKRTARSGLQIPGPRPLHTPRRHSSNVLGSTRTRKCDWALKENTLSPLRAVPGDPGHRGSALPRGGGRP